MEKSVRVRRKMVSNKYGVFLNCNIEKIKKIRKKEVPRGRSR